VARGPKDELRTLAGLLETRSFGRAHEHHGVLPSTNDRALEWAQEGAPAGALVTADGQSAGRGRHGRSWSSPAGEDIYASLILRPACPARELAALGLAVGVGLREGLLPVAGEVALKWPNDLLAGGRKLAGILCETRWRGDRAEAVVGFGINVHRRSFSPELESSATSLALVVAPAPAPGRAQVLARVLATLEDVLSDFFAGGFAAVRGRYEPHLAMLGERVRVCRSGREIIAIAEGLLDDGALMVRPEGGGPLERVDSADVWIVRSTVG
jgi:BirA family biotin operon repressor/biotin-[acetyl-CoA-carboxylase] ligase